MRFNHFFLTNVIGGLILVSCLVSGQEARQFMACHSEESNKKGSQSLYVATLDEVFVYSIGATTPRIVLDHGLANITQIALDREGNVYASSFGTGPNYADSSVTEFQPLNTSPALTRTQGAFSANGVAVDVCGNVYTSSYYPNTVSVYHPDDAEPFLEMKNGINGPGLLQTRGNELFVGLSGTGEIVRFPGAAVLGLKAPGPLPAGALTYGGPFVLDADSEVVAGGYVVASDLGFEEFVNVFARGATSPRFSIKVSSGNEAASAPYLATHCDRLFVSVSDRNTVLEYQFGDAGITLKRTITDGLSQPGPLAVDRAGYLYVANLGGQINVYAPGATKPLRTFGLPAGASQLVSAVFGS